MDKEIKFLVYGAVMFTFMILTGMTIPYRDRACGGQFCIVGEWGFINTTFLVIFVISGILFVRECFREDDDDDGGVKD